MVATFQCLNPGKVEKVGHKAKKTVSSLKINKEKDKTLAAVSEWGFGGSGLARGKNLDPGVESEEEEEMEDDLLDGVHHDLMIPHPRRDILHSRSVVLYFSHLKTKNIQLLLSV